MPGVVDQCSTPHKLEQGHTLLYRSSSNDEEVLAIGLGESAIALGNVGGDREGGAVELVDQKAVAARELLSRSTDFVGEVEGLLVDQQLFELERHFATPKK